MIKYLIKSLEFDVLYSVNSVIYILRDLPVVKDLLTEDIYKQNILKKVISIFMFLFFIARTMFFKFSYFFIIFSVFYGIFPNQIVKSYFHVYFVLTTLGIFINNKLLNVNKKKYLAIRIFKMNANKYAKMSLLWSQLSNLILNSICILIYGNIIASPIKYSFILITYTFFARFIGEALNIKYYKKHHYMWYSNSKIYIATLFTALGFILLQFIGFFIPLKFIEIATYISIIIGTVSLIYLFKTDDYKLIYERLFSIVNIMNPKNDKDYFKQAMIEVKTKDKIIDNKKLVGKKGYDLFNIIFFERHKEILIRSAKKYSFILIIAYTILSYLVVTDPTYKEKISSILTNNLGWFVIVMYFVNRGGIVTQAMFFNCDHAMLSYNFYRQPNTILGLFKKRLLTISKVNLLPAVVIGIGNVVLLVLSGNSNLLIISTTFLFIIFTSVLFSLHYLVIYYLLQPFNKNMEVKKISYSFATFITYIVCYLSTRIIINSILFSILGLIITIIYILLALNLVYKYAPKTFKLN